MPFAIRIHETGGPEKFVWENVEVAKPGPGEVLVRNRAVGLNFVDTYYRSGLYPLPLPATLGKEGVGVIEAVGPKVRGWKVGDRVGYVDPIGAYAEVLLRPADQLVEIPAGISDEVAASVLLKGLTAEYLLRQTYRVKRGDVILVHAAAGGVGQILCQWAKHLGAVVIGVVGSEEKAKLAKRLGCKHVLVRGSGKISDRVREITRGQGVPVVYDSVGQETFLDSLDCLQPRGLMVSYGNASGPVAPFPLGILAQKGSLYVTRPTLHTYAADPKALDRSAKALFALIKKGAVKVSPPQRFLLREAARAHVELQARRTTGSTILIP